METIRGERRTAFATPWPYAGIAVLSVFTAPLFGLTLLLGIVVGMIGAFRGAFSRHESGRIHGVHIFLAGIACLAGPAAFLLLYLLPALRISN